MEPKMSSEIPNFTTAPRYSERSTNEAGSRKSLQFVSVWHVWVRIIPIAILKG